MPYKVPVNFNCLRPANTLSYSFHIVFIAISMDIITKDEGIANISISINIYFFRFDGLNLVLAAL